MEKKEDILKFGEFSNIKENTYKVNDEGEMEKQEWELYEDHYSEKYMEFLETDKTKKLFETDKVWVLKHMDIKVGVFSNEIDADRLKQALEIFRK